MISVLESLCDVIHLNLNMLKRKKEVLIYIIYYKNKVNIKSCVHLTFNRPKCTSLQEDKYLRVPHCS